MDDYHEMTMDLLESLECLDNADRSVTLLFCELDPMYIMSLSGMAKR